MQNFVGLYMGSASCSLYGLISHIFLDDLYLCHGLNMAILVVGEAQMSMFIIVTVIPIIGRLFLKTHIAGKLLPPSIGP